MNRHTYNVKAIEANMTPMSGKFVTNNTSAPDGLSNNLSSVTRTAAGKFTVVFKDQYPQCYFPDARVVGAAGYQAYVTSVDVGSNGNVTGCKLEIWNEGAVTAAVAATSTITADTKANTTQGDYFFLNDGQRVYGFELDVAGSGATHAIAPTAATGLITCGTKAQTANDGDYIILNDGQERYCFELDADGGGATLVLGGTTDYGNSITAVDVSGDTTAADVAGTLKTAIDSTSIQMTVTDNADGTLTLTQENEGTMGNTQQVEACANAAWILTDMTGALDADVQADVWTVVDISGATTAADITALLETAINATDIQAAATDATGTVTLANDTAGTHGNTQQSGLGTLHNAWAVTDFTGGVDGTRAAGAAADTTDYDVYLFMWMRNSKETFR